MIKEIYAMIFGFIVIGLFFLMIQPVKSKTLSFEDKICLLVLDEYKFLNGKVPKRDFRLVKKCRIRKLKDITGKKIQARREIANIYSEIKSLKVEKKK